MTDIAKYTAINAITRIPEGSTTQDAINAAEFILNHKYGDFPTEKVRTFLNHFYHYDCFETFGDWAKVVVFIANS